ncbi:MAG: VOC family protein [Clostridiaceae bacterium]|nr:VOC family protein [Clostridiaceae bacterium]
MEILQTFNRFYVSNMDCSLAFYENLLGESCCLRTSFPQSGLELAQVGKVLLLAGTVKSLIPVKDTVATFVVDDIGECERYLLANSAEVVKAIKETATGFNMTVKHADGIIVEYVQFNHIEK